MQILQAGENIPIDNNYPFPTMTPDVTAEAGFYSGAGDPISWGAGPVGRDG